MNKAVFRPGELIENEEKVFLEPPTAYPELSHLSHADDEYEEEEHREVYTGPTVEDLRREAELFKEQWEQEKEDMLNSARDQADQIIKDAQEAAFREVKRQTEEAQVLKRQAEDEAEAMIAEATEKAAQIERDAGTAFAAQRKEAEEEARKTGMENGFEEGKAEVERLIQRTQVVLARAQDKRVEILEDTEKEIVSLVLLIAKKVVKAISENQRNVIVSNVVHALRKVKGKGKVIIRVNMADLKMTTEHTKDFINMLEGIPSVQVLEDSSVDEGGCIIETDFGEIDARIASQLAELEAKILEISPIKSTEKSVMKTVQKEITNGK